MKKEVQVRSLAKLGLSGGLSKEHVLTKLSTTFGSEFSYIVEEVFSLKPSLVVREVLAAGDEAEVHLNTVGGFRVDCLGNDLSDRAALSMLEALGHP